MPVDAAWMDQSLAILAGKLSAPWPKKPGYVLDVFLDPDKLPLLMIDLGTAQGARVGRQVEISTAGDPIVHPVTKEILGTRDIPLATASIIKTDKEFSYARVVDRTGVVPTPVKTDSDGIDLGIERMQRVCLTDVQSDFAADAGMSILSVMKYVPIRSDIPDATLRVDWKDVTLSGGSASVRMAAGTHLVKLQVRQSLLSREVTVTKSGVRPKQVAFQKADLASAVAIKPPDTAPPAQLQAVSVRTEPELAAGDEKTVDQKLMALLPKPDEIDRQLREAKDQHVIDVFDVGLRSLRLGYARGSRSYLSIAASQFAEFTRLAPELALGYFNLGLARFYLDQLDDTQAAFQQAVKLDKSLQEDVPLLWWERFNAIPDDARTRSGKAVRYRWSVTNDGHLSYASEEQKVGKCIILSDGTDYWTASNTVTEIRFRFVRGNCNLGLYARGQSDPQVITSMYSVGEIGITELNSQPDGNPKSQRVRRPPPGNGWHIARLELDGAEARLYVDGSMVNEIALTQTGSGWQSIGLMGDGEQLLD